VDLHELSPVGRWPAGGRDGRRLERFAQVCQDLPDRPWLGDERDQPDVATTPRARNRKTCYKAGAARRVGTTPRSRSQTASQVKHELARRQITFLSGEICPAPGSRACPKAWNPPVQAVVGEAEVSRGRSTEAALPMRTGRTERRRTRRSHRTVRRERSPSSPTPSRAGEETTGSLSRPGRTAAALCEKPRLGLLARIPEDSGTR
jgi:hypothetical protein